VLTRSAKPTRVGILAFGTTHYAIEETRHQLSAEKHVETDYLRVRSFPFGAEVREFFDTHDHVYVVEQNRDAQFAALLRIEMSEVAPKIRSVLRYDGFPVAARELTEEIASKEKHA
jgi:2-oxoglutarate ferredoxin oxidoreductase subunit alpha